MSYEQIADALSSAGIEVSISKIKAELKKLKVNPGELSTEDGTIDIVLQHFQSLQAEPLAIEKPTVSENIADNFPLEPPTPANLPLEPSANQTQAGVQSIAQTADKLGGVMTGNDAQLIDRVATRTAEKRQQLEEMLVEQVAEQLAMQSLQGFMGAMSQALQFAGDSTRFFSQDSPIAAYTIDPTIIDIKALPSAANS